MIHPVVVHMAKRKENFHGFESENESIVYETQTDVPCFPESGVGIKGTTNEN